VLMIYDFVSKKLCLWNTINQANFIW